MKSLAQIFAFNKDQDKTSFDVIRKFKKEIKGITTKMNKIGHFGTLDPFATGLLLIGTNGAARLNDLTQSYLTKTYLACGTLGIQTSTGDQTVDSTIIHQDEHWFDKIKDRDKEQINLQLKKEFLGEISQIPPQYSALKHLGRPLYKYAREGVFIEKPARKVHIYSLDILEIKNNEMIFRVEVSSGTYIRVLFEDMATSLGTYGTLKELTREKIGNINIPEKNSHSIDLDELLPLTKIQLNHDQVAKFYNGQSLIPQFTSKNLNFANWAYAHYNNFIIGAGIITDNIFFPKIVFHPNKEK